MPSVGYVHLLQQLPLAFNRRTLDDLPTMTGPTVELFEPCRYLTGPARRDPRWRVSFNGLGSLQYCATVERTPTIEELLNYDILARAQAFLAELGPAATDRALSWAYQHETESSPSSVRRPLLQSG